MPETHNKSSAAADQAKAHPYKKADLPQSNDTPQGADQEDILSLLSLLETPSSTNATGWSHDNAQRTLRAKEARRQPDEDDEDDNDDDFFSHLDPELREHLRKAHDRKTRHGYTGDLPQEHKVDVVFPVSMTETVEAIRPAIKSPAKESKEQVARRQRVEEMHKDNKAIDDLNAVFAPTLKGSMKGLDSNSEGE